MTGVYDSDRCKLSPLLLVPGVATGTDTSPPPPPFEEVVDDEEGVAAGSYPPSEPDSCSSLTPMSGMFLTRSRRKSNRLSEMMHCFMWDGDRVLALRAFVIRRVFVSSDSTNSSRVRGVGEMLVKEKFAF